MDSDFENNLIIDDVIENFSDDEHETSEEEMNEEETEITSDKHGEQINVNIEDVKIELNVDVVCTSNIETNSIKDAIKCEVPPYKTSVINDVSTTTNSGNTKIVTEKTSVAAANITSDSGVEVDIDKQALKCATYPSPYGKLWLFIRDLLQNENYNPSIIKYVFKNSDSGFVYSFSLDGKMLTQASFGLLTVYFSPNFGELLKEIRK